MAGPEAENFALVTLSKRGLILARKLSRDLGGQIFAHQDVGPGQGVIFFERIMDLTADIFSRFRGIVYIAPSGVAARCIARCIEHKGRDPAVVVVDIGGRWAISLLSGHEGGANALALKTANSLGCEPVITTTSQALKDIIVGLGCRRGTAAGDIVQAINLALNKAGVSLDMVRLLATADIKKGEAGLISAAEKLGLSLYFLSSARIRNMPLGLKESEFVKNMVGLPGVAEPCALLAGKNARLILGKTVCKGVTIALARESFLWLE